MNDSFPFPAESCSREESSRGHASQKTRSLLTLSTILICTFMFTCNNADIGTSMVSINSTAVEERAKWSRAPNFSLCFGGILGYCITDVSAPDLASRKSILIRIDITEIRPFLRYK